MRLWCSAIKHSRCFLRWRSSSRSIWWRRISDQSCWQCNNRGDWLTDIQLSEHRVCCELVYVCHLIVSHRTSSSFWSCWFQHSCTGFGSRRGRRLHSGRSRSRSRNLPQQALLTHCAGQRRLEWKSQEEIHVIRTSKNWQTHGFNISCYVCRTIVNLLQSLR